MKGYKPNKKTNKNLRAIMLLFISLIFVSIAVSVAIIGCDYIANRNFKETFYSVSSLKVNNKIRIIQLSDLHDCAYGDDNSKLISRVEKLKPDLIICTGDLIDSKSSSDDRVINLCKKQLLKQSLRLIS